MKREECDVGGRGEGNEEVKEGEQRGGGGGKGGGRKSRCQQTLNQYEFDKI